MSTLRSCLVITVCLLCQRISADYNAPEGEVQCRYPLITEREYISDNKEYYNKGEEITLRCREGYTTSTKTIRCDKPGTPQEWTPPIDLCRPLCRKPENSILKLDPAKTFYNIGDTVTVTCRVGYLPSYPSAQCVNREIFSRWNNTLLCVEMCRKPEISILQLDPEKKYYNIGDTVTVKCPVEFVPSYPSAQCVNHGFVNRWNTTVHCRALCRKPVDQVMVTMDPEKTFYDIGDKVTVTCPVGYVPSYPSAQCMNDRFFIEWSNYPHCVALCKMPGDTMMTMDPEKTFYDIGDTVTVKCPVGFRNSYPSVQCVKNGRSIEWNNPPQCVGYCKKPTLGNVSSFYVNKRHYNKGEWIAVQCKPGYSPTSETMTCDNPRSFQEWTPPTVTCIAQCKRPTIDNVDNLFMDKRYYNKGEKVIIRCKSGYYPTSSSMECNNPHASLEWSPPTVTCIGVTFMNWKVTSISISFQLSCTPQCPDTWSFFAQVCPKTEYYYYGGSCKDLNGKGGTFTDLKPSSKYNIQTKLYTEHGEFNLVHRVIWTDDSVTSQPEILKVPSMEDNTIIWRLSEEWGNITGFQMNISAWRDYNVSFAVDESLQFPPNVTEYKIPLQHGTNYTIALRGLTTSGAKEVTTENIETDIGDPPLHMEKTLHGDILQLYPVPNLNGPIRSYEVIVFGGQDGNSTKECLTFKTTPYNFIWSLTGYTAVVLPAENLTGPRTFTLGDNLHYNGFHNAPLIPNANYTVYIRVTSHWKHVETSSCAFAGVIKGVTGGSLIPVMSGSSLGIIIGLLVLILLVLLCLVVVHFTPWMKQKLLRERI